MRLRRKLNLRFNDAIRSETLREQKHILGAVRLLCVILASCTFSAIADVPLPNINTNSVINVTSAPYNVPGDNSTDDAIAINSTLTTVVTNQPLLVPANPVYQITGNQLQLSWPADHLDWTLETNAVGLTVTKTWFPYPGSASLTNLDIPFAANRTNLFLV